MTLPLLNRMASLPLAALTLYVPLSGDASRSGTQVSRSILRASLRDWAPYPHRLPGVPRARTKSRISRSVDLPLWRGTRSVASAKA